MKSKICILVFIFISLNTQLFALGRSEEDAEVKKLNNEWVLCVTDFDVKALPQSKLSVASVITRKVVERLNEISFRTRVSPEYAYYEGYEWYRARSTAAKSLSAKLDERSLLIFNGEPNWRYKQNLARVDADIEKLTAAFEEIDKNAPVIENEPVFKLTAGNTSLTYPEPPKEGNEYKFCKDQKADAFLAGKVIDFHGRYQVSVKLYVVYTKSFIYEDSIIFSPDDLDSALEEIISKLMLTVSGSRPAAIAVKAEPEDTLVLINKSFAGRGDIGIIERAPGKFIITASANEHESITVETELAAGEIAEIQINLLPQEFGNVEIPGTSDGSTVYQGALYVGETPLTLRLPVNILEYVEIERGNKQKGTAVFHTPDDIDTTLSLPVKTRTPPAKGQVEKARSMFYWSWGGVWISGIAAWIAYHTYSSSNYALSYGFYQTNTFDQKFADDNSRMYYISMGSIVAVSAAAAYWVFSLSRYLYVANRGSTKVQKTGRTK
ncbi:MAG: hypothetical protein LBI04_04655 [Treponema sp.]|jgi:hypothetical protein|nr:hypothetical protein [Treponema sp.]